MHRQAEVRGNLFTAVHLWTRVGEYRNAIGHLGRAIRMDAITAAQVLAGSGVRRLRRARGRTSRRLFPERRTSG